MKLGFEHSYAALPPRFYAELAPEPVRAPRLVAFNDALARGLGLDPEALRPRAAAIFSGNELPEDSRPLAQAYAGHQFGRFVPQLGDGRALLLGELVGPGGERHDLQLKGSGRTPFSRAGDGRAALGPMLREYVISEAMHALGIPTTRALAVVATGEVVLRDSPLPGAVLARVAASHIRVGTFQFFAARGDSEGVSALLDHVVARHYPSARDAECPALSLLEQVTARQARLVARWMLAGFIHGVMNTDNMALSGETIDYGPCAFMDAYHPDTVFSSIDHHGRYAWGNQPHVAQWNLARLAECLLPLVDADAGRAVERATAVLESFTALFDAAFLEGMRTKLGLATASDGDSDLAQQLLSAMQAGRTDHTNAFRALAGAAEGGSGRTAFRALFPAESPIDDWLQRWEARTAGEPGTAAERAAAMRAASPAFIPRNHLVERALAAASDAGDLAPFEALLAVVRHPFEDQPGREDYARPPRDDERVLATFCGT